VSLPSSCSHLLMHAEHIFSGEEFHAQILPSFVGSRTRFLSICSPKFFHCTARPRLIVNLSIKDTMRYSLPPFSGTQNTGLL
jgi:hypothetical protein